MTAIQKIQIQRHRTEGLGYTAISQIMGLPYNTVKSFCKRNNLGGRLATNISVETQTSVCCKKCGAQLVQTEGRKVKKFCSTVCRLAWWNKHPEKVNRKAVYNFKCACCGSDFTAYGNKSRKYCSHACYIKERFGKVAR